MYNTIANAIDKVYNRDQEEKRTSQGATNCYGYSVQDNAGTDQNGNIDPVVLRFRLPDDLLNVNKCVLDWQTENFRTYSQGAAAGGGTTIGMDTDTTTAGGGGTTIGIDTDVSSSTTADAVATSGEVQEEFEFSNESGEDWQKGTTNTRWSCYRPAGDPKRFDEEPYYISEESGDAMTPVFYYTAGSGSERWRTYTNIYKHDHPHHHNVTVKGHNHKIPHTHILGDHVHRMPHTHTTPDHTHNLEYGIYKEPTLAVSGIRIKVDGAILDGVYGLDKEGLDIIPYLRMSGDRVDRGMHTVKFYPVASGANKACLLYTSRCV